MNSPRGLQPNINAHAVFTLVRVIRMGFLQKGQSSSISIHRKEVSLMRYSDATKGRRFAKWCSLAAAMSILVGLTVSGETKPAYAAPVTAESAHDFYESIGFTVHIDYIKGTPEYSNIVKPLLVNSGVKYIRDGGKSQEFFDVLNDLAHNHGIKSTLVMWPDGDNDASNVPDNYILPAIDSIVAVEGPNEPDFQQYTYRGMNWWPNGVRFFQNDLYDKMKAHSDARIRAIEVLAPSIGHPENSSTIGTVKADGGNMHSYQGGAMPDDQLLTRWIPNAQLLTGSKPITVTETGYHYRLHATCAGQPGISEAVGAKYAPRVYLDYFNAGIKRTHLYNLQMTGDDCWAMIRQDGTPRPAYFAIKNLVSLIRDDTDIVPGSLDYSLSGNTQDLRQLLLQKSDGKFYLILWLNKKSYDQNAQTDLNVPAQQVTLSFGQPVSGVRTYLPSSSSGTSIVGNYGGSSSISLNVPDEPLVVEIDADSGGASVSYEAEDEDNTFVGTGPVPCSGCSSGYKVNWLGSGNEVSINNVEAATAGSKAITLHYTNGGSDSRTFHVSANGNAAVTVSAPPTGGWDTVGTAKVNVVLNAGLNEIKLYNPDAGAPDLDRIVVSPGPN